MSDISGSINEQRINLKLLSYKDMLKEIKDKEKTLIKLIKDSTNELYSVCNHQFVRECTTSGCYAEYHNVCQKCNMTQW